MRLDRDKIADIKNSVNIVDVINQVTQLTKAGRNYLGLCPFHKEKTPSFNVVEDKQFYHCFGCGKSGDVFKFLEETQQISFTEAVRQVADQAGIILDVQLPTSPRPVSPNQSLYDINRDAAKFYHAILMTTKEGQAAKAYLASRGLTDDLLNYFEIGLAPDASDYLYQRLGKDYDEATLTNSGLFTLTNQGQFLDSFRQRIMFPLTDEQGRVIGFSGRIWQDNSGADQPAQAKYKNTRSTPIFNKSYELYHLAKAKSVIQKTKEVYLMEGFMDVIAAYRAGIVNAVASMGTALTPDHISHLRKYAKKVILTYDGDSAGQAAIAKSLQLIEDLQVDIVSLPNQMDPDEFLQENSPEALAKLLEQARIGRVEFFSRHLLPENLDNIQAQIAYLEEMARWIAREESDVARNAYIHLVADLVPDFDYRVVEDLVNRLTVKTNFSERQSQQPPPQFSLQQAQQVLEQGQVLDGLTRIEYQLFYRLLTKTSLLEDFYYREDFFFQQPSLDRLYRLLLEERELTSPLLADLPDEVSQVYYQVLSGSYPQEEGEEEIQDLLARRDHYLGRQLLTQKEKEIRTYSKHGDVAGELDALNALIAQKRNLE